MKTMAAGNFKAKCLAVIDEVHDRHEEVIITKRGKPMAKLIPIDQKAEKPDDFFGFMEGWAKITGDVLSPVDPAESWDVEK